MAVRVLIPPATEPVSIEEVLEYLRLDVEVDGEPPATLSALIQAAREVAEDRTARALMRQTLELSLDAFPCGTDPIHLPRPPLVEVERVTYLDQGEEVELDAGAYVVDTSSEPGRIAPAPGHVWPVADCVPGAVRIRYVAGYGDDPAAVPQKIRTAMLMLVGGWWDQPEAISQRQYHEVPWAAGVLLDQARAHGWIG